VFVVYNSSAGKFQLLTTPQPATGVTIAVGSVMAWPLETVPAGTLECNGQAVSRSTYAALFSAIGSAYGPGDGSTTFNLPDYRDYFLRGYSSTGADAASRTDRGDGTTGASVGTKQADEVKAHVHTQAAQQPTFTFSKTTVDDGGETGTDVVDSIAATGLANAVTAAADATPGDTASTGGTETRPKNITVKWVMIAVPAVALATSGIGKNETWIGARSMTARADAGAGAATRDSGSNNITSPVLDFDKTTQEYAHFEWVPPKRWDKGAVSFIPYWSADAGTAAETMAWTLAGVALSNDDATDAAMGTAQTSADALIATGDLHVGPESAAITIAGSPAAGDLGAVEISRDVANDTLNGDARLLGIKLIWTSNATSDD
jgi:microcystin-dependent protein